MSPRSGSRRVWPPSTATWRARSNRIASPKNSATQHSSTSRRPAAGGSRRLRPGHRIRRRGRSRQAPDLCRAVPTLKDTALSGDQHLVDFDHPPGRHHRPARALHGHPLHEPGAAHGTGRAGARHRHRRRHLHHRQGIRRKPRQDGRGGGRLPGLHGQPHPAADDQRGGLHAL